MMQKIILDNIKEREGKPQESLQSPEEQWPEITRTVKSY